MFDPIPYAAADVRESLGDYLAVRANLRPTDPHPIADVLARGRQRASLMDIARHLAGLSPGAPDHQVRSLLAREDFGNDLAFAMSRVIGIAYDRQAAEHLQICFDVPVRGTMPTSLPVLDLGELTPTPKAGGPLQLPLAMVTPGATVQPVIWSARFLLPRPLLVNDDAGIIAAAAQQLSGHAARVEAQSLAALVNANDNLPDGSPLIGAGNSTTETGITAASVAEALGKLRTNLTPSGNVANVRGAYLLVPPSLEATALIVAAAMSLGTTPRLVVVVNAWLSGSAAYLLAAPQDAPVFVRSYPESSGPLRPDIGRISATVYDETGAPLVYDGQAYLFEHIVGIAAVDRQGIVRLSAA